AFFDVAKFGADFAYTLDGGAPGEIEYENFNAASMVVRVKGLNIHPGSAKDKMKNACLIAMEFNALLPVEQRPEYTEGYDGFFHLMSVDGSVEHTAMTYIIRDHDSEKLEQKKAVALAAAAFLNGKYGEGTVEVVIRDSYRNMKEQILPHMHLIENARAAMETLGIAPITVPIRGGTDGARLSFMGLPCPNLCAGGHNAHGRFEYTSVQALEKCFDIAKEICRIYAEA
ncbi:MAG: peptidase T, partial [Oscillospiraceae bacterium]|nr:peptidase T [Oscillospiraceae bacterium]